MRSITQRHAASCIAVVCALVAVPSWCRAQDGSEAKAELSKRGVTLTIVYAGTVFSNAGGGVRRGDTYTGNLNLELSLDGHVLFGLPGLTAYVDGLWIHGGQPSAVLGDAQGVSNLAAPAKITANEAWLQYNLLGNRFSALAGRFDVNTEFYRLQAAGLFLNSSFGVGPEFGGSGVAGPSTFPDTSAGVRLAFKPAPNMVLRIAVLDGVPVDRPDGSVGLFESGDGLLLVSEAAFLNRKASGERRTKLRFRIGRASGLPPYKHKVAAGGWYYTATFDDLDRVAADGQPIRHRGSGGMYVLGDAALLQSRTDPGRRLAWFIEAGLGDGRVNRFGTYLGSGLVATGPLSRRSSDEVGVAVAIARNGPAYTDHQRRGGAAVSRAETAIEVTYLAQVSSWLAVQPDLQYVIHPNTDPLVRNGLAFQLRFEATF